MSSVVSLLWPKAAPALAEHLGRVPANVQTIATLQSSVDSAMRERINEDAAQRAAAICSELRAGGSSRAEIVARSLEERLGQSMMLVAALDALHERDAVELVALSEDVTATSKTVAAWARARGVPSVAVSHSCILGRLYTVHREQNTDTLAVFGERGALPYLEMGVAKDRIAVTGNPAWDVYPSLRAQRPQLREDLAKKFGFSSRDHIVVFATTWSAYFTAFTQPEVYEESLRAVVRSVQQLRALGVPLQLVIKERPSNGALQPVRDRVLREEAGGYTPVIVDSDLERLIAASDCVVSVDSNVSIEAQLAGVPAINLWYPESWLNGPFFDAEDGVLETVPENLARSMAQVLGDPEFRGALVAQGRSKLDLFAAFAGGARSQAANLFTARRKQSETRYVWQELANPRGVAEKGVDSVYYRSARTDMIARLRRAPARMLDIGCGAGATGAEIKKAFPSAHVTGIELNKEAAALAQGRVDRILVANVETMDFAEAGIAPGSVDLVFFPDVLEHLYDPWNLLVRIKPFLTKDAQILASIPNVRNLWLLSQLIGGNWPYAEEGLLDVTHIRFFTKKTAVELFEQTGYRVQAIFANADGRVPALQSNGAPVNIDTAAATFKNLSPEDLIELRTLQFILDCTPI